MNDLPIDQILPELLYSLAHNSAVVVQAPPGAGKTTRIPLALLEQEWLADQTVLMLQPRRIAARHAAEYMATQLGETVGQRIGYSIRFEHNRSRKTRIEVVTEGILTRRLQADPELNGVGLVIFDEFHERNIHSDLALALCLDSQQGLRNDLKLLVMSATLDAEPVAALLDNCPILTSAGRSYPITTRYLPQPEKKAIAESIAIGVKTALADTAGDILAFLPGAGEIHRCAELLAPLSEIDIRPLFGSLPFVQQRQAIAPGNKRRVVLATNIAETSLTIDGISTVVDSGWERRPRFDVSSATTRLELKRISTASATQRQGRAGRLGPGTCYRLWSEGQQAELLPQAPAEIRSANLAPLLLELACWGETEPQRLNWLDPPSQVHLSQAKDQLQQLGALGQDGRATGLGQQLVRLPLPPHLARLVIAAQQDGYGTLACELAMLLSERDILQRTPTTERCDCDLQARWQLFKQKATAPTRTSLQRVANDLKRIIKTCGNSSWPMKSDLVQHWLAVAYPGRIARQRHPGSDRYLLSDGSGAVLSPRSGVQRPPFLIALQMEQRPDQAEIVIASAISRSILETVFAKRLKTQRQISWDTKEQRVISREVRALGALVVAEKPVKATAQEQILGTLEGIRKIGLNRLNWSAEAKQLLARVQLCGKYDPQGDWPEVSIATLTEQLEQWLAPFLRGITTRAALELFDPLPALKTLLPWHLQQQLTQLVPERYQVPSGSQIRIDYMPEEVPVLAVKLQELFGLGKNPAILNGRQPLQIHLLSPAGRPLAVTQDLEHFWKHSYPEVRKEMRGRYPKHPWPEDPWNAPATARTKNTWIKR